MPSRRNDLIELQSKHPASKAGRDERIVGKQEVIHVNGLSPTRTLARFRLDPGVLNRFSVACCLPIYSKQRRAAVGPHSRLNHHRQVRAWIRRRHCLDVEREVIALVQNRCRPDARADRAGRVILRHHRIEALRLRVDRQNFHTLLALGPELQEDESAHFEARGRSVVGGGRDGLRRATSGDRVEAEQSVVGIRQAARLRRTIAGVDQVVVGDFVSVRQLLCDAHLLQHLPRRASVAADLHQERRLAICRALLEVGVDAPDRRGILHLHRDGDVFLHGERAGDLECICATVTGAVAGHERLVVVRERKDREGPVAEVVGHARHRRHDAGARQFRFDPRR